MSLKIILDYSFIIFNEFLQITMFIFIINHTLVTILIIHFVGRKFEKNYRIFLIIFVCGFIGSNILIYIYLYTGQVFVNNINFNK